MGSPVRGCRHSFRVSLDISTPSWPFGGGAASSGPTTAKRSGAQRSEVSLSSANRWVISVAPFWPVGRFGIRKDLYLSLLFLVYVHALRGLAAPQKPAPFGPADSVVTGATNRSSR